MADVNQIITLGVGTPSDIPHFILVGLSVNPVEHTLAAECLTVTVAADPWLVSVPADAYSVAIAADEWLVTVPACED